MKSSWFLSSLLTGVTLSFWISGASAQSLDDERFDRDDASTVFVQSNDPAGNHILAYHRAADGSLAPVASYATGGQGGRLDGAAADPLASQGSLRLDPTHHLLIGVNAGSNTVYSFHVEGDDHRLSDRQVVPSGGTFPVSVAVHGDLVYVLNARGSGTVQGYRVDDDGRLLALADSARSLGLQPNPTSTEFLTTPGQIGFTPDGRHLIVTTKANASGSHIDVFQVRADGRLSATPVANPSSTPVPFAFTFDAQRQLVVGEAGTSTVATYTVHDNGTVTPIGTASVSQAALCWIARDGDTYFVSNAGSGSVSAFHVGASGQPSLLGTTSVGAGPIDLTVAGHGRFLYVELGGAGTIATLRVGDDGSLTSIGTVAGHAGQEGIVAL